jgi:hypothetical protein
VPHGVTSPKSAFFIVTAVKTSNITYGELLSNVIKVGETSVDQGKDALGSSFALKQASDPSRED